MADHKPGCEGLGGYGHGAGPCGCGADAQTPVLTDEELVILRHTTRMAAHQARASDLAFGRAVEAAVVAKLAAQAPAQPAEAKPVGAVTTMPGTSGFGLAAFKLSEVPLGTKLYTHPAPSQPARAVMQQALDALETIASLATGEGDVCEIIAKRARAAIAALSATMEKN